MKARELINLGVPKGPAIRLTLQLVGDAKRWGLSRMQIHDRIQAIVADPAAHVDDPEFGPLAKELAGETKPVKPFVHRAESAPWRQWGTNLDTQAIRQMQNACELPVSVSGALMPDAHVGYGLPIGGVLATRDAVIPYAVGVDIACRMRMSVYDLPVATLKGETDRLISIINRETRFGIGAEFKGSLSEHPVMDDDWAASPVTLIHKDKARRQLGTSGSGNHFVEFGTLTLDHPDLGIAPGTYIALLTHSGSRGTGSLVANHYSRLAMDLRPELPKELRHLAWLNLNTGDGQEYWRAMQLMGKYAAANHAIIHRRIARALRADVIADIENHHNFAWKETHNGETVIVHRKGATPAHEGVLGIIPGSMASPAYVVRGRGEGESLRSASHGAGRVMSRTQAKRTFTWSAVKKLLAERGVTLISAGLDEAPMVYKNIDEVMSHQADLVEVIARFDPKIVKMAPPGEKPED
ncbi:MAG: RtcB family protein [Phycisphaerales bacterium]|nr:RtcB family protein [Phycisphaerales bacterium]